RQAPLDGAEGALAAATGLGRAGQNLADAEGAQGLTDLAVLLSGRTFTDLIGTAEVAAAIGIELAEAAEAAQHRFQRGEGRGRALLLEAAGVEHATIGVVQ